MICACILRIMIILRNYFFKVTKPCNCVRLCVQAALVIREFVIHGFGYPNEQFLLSADFSLGYPWIRYFLNAKKTMKDKNLSHYLRFWYLRYILGT